MPSTFELAGAEIDDLAREIIQAHHKDLDTVGVKIDFLMTFRDPEGEEPALKLRGHRALGIASIEPLKNRVRGCGDALVQLDGDEWAHMTEARQRALVDHEINHFEVARDKTGEILYDDLQRPRLKMRLHDREIGWFDVIASRHGVASEEVRQFASLLSDEAVASYIDRAAYPEIETPIRKLQRLAREAGGELTVSVSGGPEMPLSEEGGAK